MTKELAYVIINPYSITKSRTGGIIARYLSRAGLNLAGARMFGPSEDLARKYSDSLRENKTIDSTYRDKLADYVLRTYMPDPKTGKRNRALMLLFEGENAIEKIRHVTGPLRQNMEAGETIRDTFGDYIVNNEGELVYLEPAVLIGTNRESTREVLHLWCEHEKQDSGKVDNARDLPDDAANERTLVLIKPDNFRFPSARPGNIIDMFSRSGLRIVAAKLHRMSCAEGEEFYNPVRKVLLEKLKGKVGDQASDTIERQLDIELPPESVSQIGDIVGPLFAEQQFSNIVEFMTGSRPEECSPEMRDEPGEERCLALIYSGKNAVEIIRSILGPTDPTKAATGTVRRELGQNIMVNAAHASDSAENAQREIDIINFEEKSLSKLVEKYYPV